MGGLLQTGLESGVKFGVQYGLNELTGGVRPPASQIQQAVATTAPAPTPVVTMVQPAAPASSVNFNTLMIVGAIAVLAIVISRR